MQLTPHIAPTQAQSLSPAEARHTAEPELHNDHLQAEAIEASLTLYVLMREEADLRGRAEELESQAKELDDGDDEARLHAGKLRAKCSEDIALADKLRQEAAQLKSDPHHRRSLRISRAEIEHQVNCAMSDADQESDTAVAVQASSKEHKAIIQHAAIKQAHVEKKPAHPAPEKKSTTKAATPKKQPAVTPKPAQQQATTAVALSPFGMASIQHRPTWWGHSAYGMSSQPYGALSFGPSVSVIQPFTLVGHTWVPAQVVAAVKNVTIPAAIGPVKPQDPVDPLRPNIFNAPWNAGLGYLAHS